MGEPVSERAGSPGNERGKSRREGKSLSGITARVCGGKCTMGMTMSEKILARAAGLETTRAGDIVWVKVDKAMMDDILGPRVSIDEGLGKLGLDVKNPGQVVIISDHYTPPASVQQAEIVKFTRIEVDR